MANKYLSASLGTRSWADDTGTWVDSDGGTTPTTHPTSSDVAYLTSNSGNVTINSASQAVDTLTMTGYAGTLTVGAYIFSLNAKTHTLAGTITGDGSASTFAYLSGATFNGTATSTGVKLSGSNVTLNTGSNHIWYYVTAITGTVTLTGDLYVQDFQVATLSGAFNVHVTRRYMYSTTSTNSTIILEGDVRVSVISLNCNLTINASGKTITWDIGTYTMSNASARTFTHTAGTHSGLENISVNITTSQNFNTNGMKWGTMYASASVTLTLTSAFQAKEVRATTTYTITFSGAYDLTLDTIRIASAGKIILVAGQTLNVGEIYIEGQDATTTTLQSGTGSSNTNVNYTGLEDGYSMFCATLTDVNFTSTRKMYNWYGTHTRVTNCTVVTAPTNLKLINPILTLY